MLLTYLLPLFWPSSRASKLISYTVQVTIDNWPLYKSHRVVISNICALNDFNNSSITQLYYWFDLICKAQKTKKVAYWSEMARNAIESDFRSSKMAAVAIFGKKRVAHWSEMVKNAIESDFRSSKMATWDHFENVVQKNKKIAYWSEMARNGIKSDFRSSKMAAGGHFVKTSLWKQKFSIYVKWREMRSNWFSVIQYKGDIQLSHTCK